MVTVNAVCCVSLYLLTHFTGKVNFFSSFFLFYFVCLFYRLAVRRRGDANDRVEPSFVRLTTPVSFITTSTCSLLK